MKLFVIIYMFNVLRLIKRVNLPLNNILDEEKDELNNNNNNNYFYFYCLIK